MAELDGSVKEARGEGWAQDVLARHRWGQHGDRAAEEHARLCRLWAAAQPLDDTALTIVEQIVALEICNWNLEENFLALCGAIGSKRPVDHGTGHLACRHAGAWHGRPRSSGRAGRLPRRGRGVGRATWCCGPGVPDTPGREDRRPARRARRGEGVSSVLAGLVASGAATGCAGPGGAAGV